MRVYCHVQVRIRLHPHTERELCEAFALDGVPEHEGRKYHPLPVQVSGDQDARRADADCPLGHMKQAREKCTFRGRHAAVQTQTNVHPTP